MTRPQEKMSPHIKNGNCVSIAAVEMNYGKNILIEMNSGRKNIFVWFKVIWTILCVFRKWIYFPGWTSDPRGDEQFATVETLDPKYPSETLLDIRLRKENKSNFVPIEVVKKMLRSQNFTESCLLSNIFCWNFHIWPFFISFSLTTKVHTCANITVG